MMIKDISAASYRFLSTQFCIPSKSTLQRINGGLRCEDNVKYFEAVFAKCTKISRIVQIEFDEIYIEQRVDYKNGKLSGIGEGTDGEIGRTCQIFLMESTVL